MNRFVLIFKSDVWKIRELVKIFENRTSKFFNFCDFGGVFLKKSKLFENRNMRCSMSSVSVHIWSHMRAVSEYLVLDVEHIKLGRAHFLIFGDLGNFRKSSSWDSIPRIISTPRGLFAVWRSPTSPPGGNLVDGAGASTEAVGGPHGGQASATIGALGPENSRFERIREFTLPVRFDRVFYIIVRLRMAGVWSEVVDENALSSSHGNAEGGRNFPKNYENSRLNENRDGISRAGFLGAFVFAEALRHR